VCHRRVAEPETVGAETDGDEVVGMDEDEDQAGD
jgi:hypothetical protein